MHLEQLSYFIAVYELKSYSKAAKTIPMSSQGLIKSIHTLESELGVVLFETNNDNHPEPTIFADKVYGFAVTWCDEYTRLQNELLKMSSQQESLIVGISTGVEGQLEKKFIDGFHSTVSNSILLDFRHRHSSLCEMHLLAGKYKVAFTIYPYDSQFITVELYHENGCVLINVDNPLSKKPLLDVFDIQDQLLCIGDKDTKSYWTVTELFKIANLDMPKFIICDELFWSYRLTRDENYLSVMPFAAADVFAKIDDSVIVIPLKDYQWGFGLSWLPSHTLSSSEDEFLQYCVQYCKKLKSNAQT